jgi:hypothetical protein
MSYCRFSSDDFRCDLYIYESCMGGFITHVAGNKPRGYIPRLLPAPPHAWFQGSKLQHLGWKVWSRAWMWSNSLQMLYLDHAPRRSLTLPHAGGSFSDPTGPACAERVRGLIALGYRVPDGVVDALEEAGDE